MLGAGGNSSQKSRNLTTIIEIMMNKRRGPLSLLPILQCNGLLLKGKAQQRKVIKGTAGSVKSNRKQATTKPSWSPARCGPPAIGKSRLGVKVIAIMKRDILLTAMTRQIRSNVCADDTVKSRYFPIHWRRTSCDWRVVQAVSQRVLWTSWSLCPEIRQARDAWTWFIVSVFRWQNTPAVHRRTARERCGTLRRRIIMLMPYSQREHGRGLIEWRIKSSGGVYWCSAMRQNSYLWITIFQQ